MLGLWLPMIGGILSVKAIGLSDAYFVGQLGEQPLAAISFTFPVVMTLISLAIGLSAGASSVLSRAIGDGADDGGRQSIVTGAIAMAFIVAALLSVAGMLLIDPVFGLMGATGSTRADAVAYMQIWFAGTAFLIVPIAINGLLRASGDGGQLLERRSGDGHEAKRESENRNGASNHQLLSSLLAVSV